VLEQVRETGASGTFVLRADVIPDLGVNDRRGVIFQEDDLHAVGQGRHRVVEPRGTRRRSRGAVD
jgi:hypothetical protein